MTSEEQISDIKQQSIQLLRSLLRDSLYPHLSLAPQYDYHFAETAAVINVKLISMVFNEAIKVDVNRCELQNQWEAKRIADKWHPILFKKAINLLRKEIKGLHRQYARDKYHFDRAEQYLEWLRSDIDEHYPYCRIPLWTNNAGVDIVVEEKLSKNVQVVTHDLQLAENLSWVFYEIRDSVSEHIDSRNEVDFYQHLASFAIEFLNQGSVTVNEICQHMVDAAYIFINANTKHLGEFYKTRFDSVVETGRFITQNTTIPRRG
jgi:hypothetical protein